MCISTVFTSEHRQRTDQIVLSCMNGRKETYIAKIMAGLSIIIVSSIIAMAASELIKNSMAAISLRRTPSQTKRKISCLKSGLNYWEDRLDEIRIRKREIVNLISRVPGVEGDVLTRRYIDGNIWDQICGDLCYSWTGIHDIHKRGLRKVQTIIDREAPSEH